VKSTSSAVSPVTAVSTPARDAAERLRDQLGAQDVDRTAAGAVVAEAAQGELERHRLAVVAEVRRERRMADPVCRGHLFEARGRGEDGCPLSPRGRRDDDRGSARLRLAGARELRGHLRCGGRAAGGERVRARLRDVQAERRRRERDEERDGEQECDERPAEHAVDQGGPEARLGRVRVQVRQERDAAAVDARPQQLEHRWEDGHRPGDGAADDGDRAAGDAVEDVGADRELRSHGDRDRCPGDEHRPARGSGGARERLVRSEAARTLLA
jgi:hypothetical protein